MENIQIEIDKSTNSWVWHYGDVIINDEEFPFSVLQMYDVNSDSYAYEFTWVEKTPDNILKIQEKIIEKICEQR